MELLSNIKFSNKIQIADNISRKVLFEKIDFFIDYVLLTDFNIWGLPKPNKLYLKQALEKIQQIIKEKNLIGECHGSLDSQYENVISITNASHIIEDIILKNDKIYGKVILLDTISGKLIQSLVNENFCVFDFELRAIGNINKEQQLTEISNIITWDIKIK